MLQNDSAQVRITIPRLDTPPTNLDRYILMPEEQRRGKGPGMFDNWYSDDKSYFGMFTFLREVLRYAATDSNNSTDTVDAYVRSVNILRDFAMRFTDALDRDIDRMDDWRLFYCDATMHFSQCMYFVRDKQLNDISESCMRRLISDPYTLNAGHCPDKPDDVTAYRLAFAWIIANLAKGAQLADKNGPFVNGSYIAMTKTLRDRGESLIQYYFPQTLRSSEVVKLRDHGRLLGGKRPFYGDYWNKFVFSNKLRSCDPSLNRVMDLAQLDIFAHTQVKYSSIGLFGNGTYLHNHWLWPKTRLGLACVPSIGFLRMYNQRYAFAMRMMKSTLPFYTYRAGSFNSYNMHTFSQMRMYGQLGDDSLAKQRYQPGSLVLEGETEEWVLSNCRAVYDENDMISLYPINAAGTVMASLNVGMMVQRYEMFKGLHIEEFVLLDYRHGRAYLYIRVDNRTGKALAYYTSTDEKDLPRRFDRSGVVQSEVDFDDIKYRTIVLCNPITLNSFLAQTNETLMFESYLDGGHIYYQLDAEDGSYDVSVITRDDMIHIPATVKVRDRTYNFNAKYNQYVHLTERDRSGTGESARKSGMVPAVPSSFTKHRSAIASKKNKKRKFASVATISASQNDVASVRF